jgi:hypothetical protein
LTYRQLVILSAYDAARDEVGERVQHDPELDDLGERYLLGIVDDKGVPRVPERLLATLDGGEAIDDLSADSQATASEGPRNRLGLMATGRRVMEVSGAVELIPDADRAMWIANTR